MTAERVIREDHAHFELATMAGHELARRYTVVIDDRPEAWEALDLTLDEWVRLQGARTVNLHHRGEYREHCPTCRCLTEPTQTMSVRDATKTGLMARYLVDDGDVNNRKELVIP